jgi:hypothetical protein
MLELVSFVVVITVLMKLGEMVFGAVVVPMIWGVLTGGISGMYAGRSGSGDPATIKVP